MGRIPTGRSLLRAVLPLFVIVGANSTAHAEEGETARAVAGAGLALPVLNRTLYGAGIMVHGGADFPLGSGETHRLRLLGRWAAKLAGAHLQRADRVGAAGSDRSPWIAD